MQNTLELRAMSSLEKCFPDEPLANHPEQTQFTVFRNQRLCFQLGMCCRLPAARLRLLCRVRFAGELAAGASARAVTCLPSIFPCLPTPEDSGYLRRAPGLYPDLLRPLNYGGALQLVNGQPQVLWIAAEVPAALPAGTYPLTVALEDAETGAPLGAQEVSVRVLQAALPPQRLMHTEWFYTDCLANYYHTRAFSARHWRIIRRFLRTAVQNGINMILTPLFTPELDTRVGGERLTTQLLGITVESPGCYRFDFSQLERWVDLCLEVGVEYFEIPHLFSQWGALHAPKFVATVNGKQRRIFGWETDACGEEYSHFLSCMLPALVDWLEKKGVAGRTFFHISDEPHLESLEQYRRCRELVAPYLRGYPIIDALSDYAFYESGALDRPAPAIKCIQPFLDHGVRDLWAYYCGASGTGVTGRMMGMSLCRTRILGVQLYLAGIRGFLHWGYNFYNNRLSCDAINPFLLTDGEGFAPSGDAFLVYPGERDEPWESLRLNAMREAMEDIRTLELCEQRCGREATERAVREANGGRELTFTDWPDDPAFFHALHRRLIDLIEPV